MDMEFTDAEIREELARLGYKDVPEDKLAEFKKDLMKLISSDRSRNSSLNNSTDRAKQEVRGYPLDPSAHPLDPSAHPLDPCADSKFVPSNIRNYGNQWLRNTYKEDWHYEGGKSGSLMAQPEKSKPAVSRAYSPPVTFPDDSADRRACDHVRTSRHPTQVCSDSGSDLEVKYMKRKTSRKGTNGHRMIDESFSTTDSVDSSGVYDIYERIKNLAMRDCECGKTRPTSADTEPPYRIKGVNRNPSVLTTKKDPPHTRNLVRTKPFQRHQMYQRAWKLHPPIGEDNRQNVCREIHNRLLKKEEVKLSHKVYVPNTYVIPSEKPRYELRWAVRRCNQNYEMPPCGFFHEV